MKILAALLLIGRAAPVWAQAGLDSSPPGTAADAITHFSRADAYLHLGRLPEAKGELELAKILLPEDDPMRLMYFERLGEVELQEGDLERSEISFVDGIRLARMVSGKASVVGDLYAGMGLCVAARGKRAFAEQFLRKALELGPSPRLRGLAEARLAELSAPPAPTPAQPKAPEIGMPYIPPPLKQAADFSSPTYPEEPAGGKFALSVNYPGAGLRFLVRNRYSVEVRGQFQSDLQLAGLRLSLYLVPDTMVRPYVGIENDYARYKGDLTRGQGYAGEIYAGLEYFPLKKVSIQFDAGAAYINLRDKDLSLTKDGLEYVANFAVNWYFGSLEPW